MGSPSLVAAVLLVCCACARAEEAPKNPVSMKIFDGNTEPTTEGNNTFQSVNPVPPSAQEGTSSSPAPAPAPPAAASPRPEFWPVAVRAAAERRAKVERELAEKKQGQTPTNVSQAPSARKAYSLWAGMAAPRALPGAQPGPSDDAAAQSGQQLYDGAGAEAASKSMPAPGASAQPMAPSDTASAPEVFVAVDLDLKAHPGQYKDAVADLGRAAAFRPDHRFEPAAPSADHVSLWGWMAPDRLAQAMGVAGVTRLRVEPARLAAPRPLPGQEVADSSYIIGIRVPDQARAAEMGGQVLKKLEESGFRLVRTIGTQVAPGGEMVLVVEGTLPVRGLSRVMGYPGVLKVLPAEPEAPIPTVVESSSPQGFLRYASQRAPLLLALTLLLLIPAFGGSLLKLCQFFIPYQR